MESSRILVAAACLAVWEFAGAEAKMTSLDQVKVEATVVKPILSHSALETEIRGDAKKTQAQKRGARLEHSDCYATTPRDAFERNRKFYEKAGAGYQLKAGTKLESVKGGFMMGGGWKTSADYKKVSAHQVDLFLRIVGGKPAPSDQAGGDYDLVLTCPGYADTDAEALNKDRWAIDLPATSKKMSAQLSEILKIKISEQ